MQRVNIDMLNRCVKRLFMRPTEGKGAGEGGVELGEEFCTIGEYRGWLGHPRTV